MSTRLRLESIPAPKRGSAPDSDGKSVSALIRETPLPESDAVLDRLHQQPSAEQPRLALLVSMVLGLVQRQIWLIAALTVVTFVFAALGVATLKDRYTATALLVLDQGSTRLLESKDSRTPPPLNPDGEVELLKSDNVSLRALQKVGLAQLPELSQSKAWPSKIIDTGKQFVSRQVERITALFDVDPSSQPSRIGAESSQKDGVNAAAGSNPIPDATARALRVLKQSVVIRRRGLTDVIAIEATSTEPERAARIANAYAEAYLDEQIAAKARAIEHVESILSRQVRELDEELKKSELQIGLRQVYQDTLLRLRTAAQQRETVAPDARIASAARPPVSSDFPGVKLRLAISLAFSTIASFGFALGVAYLRDARLRGVQSEEEAELITGVPNLATVPHVRKSRKITTIHPIDEVVARPTSSYSDAIRRLYFNLQLTTNKGIKLGTVLITSADKKAGKTTLALSLARSAAIAGASVVVIDCDLRCPGLHQCLELSNEVGLVDVLTRSVDAQDAMQHDPRSTCKVIASGQVGDIPPERLLRADRLMEILRRLEMEYDLVVLDAPAIGSSAEALILMGITNAALFILRAGKTNPADIRLNVRQLRRASDASIFTILNFARIRGSHANVCS